MLTDPRVAHRAAALGCAAVLRVAWQVVWIMCRGCLWRLLPPLLHCRCWTGQAAACTRGSAGCATAVLMPSSAAATSDALLHSGCFTQAVESAVETAVENALLDRSFDVRANVSG